MYLTWYDAREKCRKLDGDLFSIQENELVKGKKVFEFTNFLIIKFNISQLTLKRSNTKKKRMTKSISSEAFEKKNRKLKNQRKYSG